MKTVNTLVGLADDASEEALHSEVSKLLETTNPLKRRLAQLETAHATLLLAQVDSDLELHNNRILESERPKWKEALLNNRNGTLELLSTLPQLEVGGDFRQAIGSEVGRVTPCAPSPVSTPVGRDFRQAIGSEVGRVTPSGIVLTTTDPCAPSPVSTPVERGPVRHLVRHSSSEERRRKLSGDDGSRQAVGSPSDQSVPPTTLEIEDTVQNRALARKARAEAAEIKWQEPQNTPENRAIAKKIANRADHLRRNVKTLTYEDSWVMAGKELGQNIY